MTFYGTDADDVTNNGSDTVQYGGNGEDRLQNNQAFRGYGGDGNDSIIQYGLGSLSAWGGAGNDYIQASSSETPSTLYGEDGNDNITGSKSNDYLDGGQGVDRLEGRAGADTIYGGDGSDSNTLTISAGANYVGFIATDVGGLYGGAGDDYLDGGRGDDYLNGGTENDLLLGGDGNDTLDGGTGTDRLLGGDGNDTIYFDNLDSIDGGAGVDFATAALSGTAITIYTQSVNIEGVYGSQLGDYINAGSQTTGGSFYGYGGADTIADSAYSDYIHGGDGNDTLYIDGTDTIVGGAGIDFANAYYSGTAVNLNTGALTIEGVYGSAFNDIINAGGQGMSGSFYGYEGDDVITSSNYADYIHGGNGFDYAAYNGNSSDYLTMFQDGIWYVGQISTGVVDQLVSIESLRFLNGDIALS